MQRRQFIGLIGGAAAWSLASHAQERGRIYRLGIMTASLKKGEPPIVAFFDELQMSGFIEGKNLKVDGGAYGPRNEQLPEIVAAIAKSPPDVIWCSTEAQMRVTHAAVRDVPIVGLTTDMVATGLVKSLASPGGNITGISLLSPELDSKRQDILIDAVPGARRMAALADGNATTPSQLDSLRDATSARGIELVIFTVRMTEDILTVMNEIKTSNVAAINVLGSPLLFANRRLIIERSAVLRLPTIFEWPEMAEEGGLIGYGARASSIFRQGARMVVKVLRGVKPADIPVEQPTNFELVINLKTAQAIGHEVPAALVLRADQVIE
ncbi:ABC transporter substrate-binding protein [Bradyrhizobium sp. CIAT3101]|uniref:ABC transporter substrate-binding protein n=1 Tax=Bradyrhizobium sp. CIAT3101 TaxID=439387 RepID=UPI0024B273B9|nr:ABC transporter substrate-binding protein [Bradyrhizobium sp. CIAT3101]WFU82091.1 ABC transporter substrate-binding protein [Bradyrhizobium sp. CIAT3101]